MDTDALYWFFSNLKFELSVMEKFNLAIYFRDVDFLNRVLSLYNINEFIHCFYDIQERELHGWLRCGQVITMKSNFLHF